MELSLSGNALRTLHRSVTCLARVGSELVLQASSSRLALHTLNASRSAYHSLSFNTDFFDSFSLLSTAAGGGGGGGGHQIQCSVLLKSVCSVLRTPVTAVERLSLLLPSPDAPKIQWTLHCLNGARKTYWLTCNAEPDVQHLLLDRSRFPSSLAVRPRDLARLLANFQSSLQEITIIATEPASVPTDAGAEFGGKAVELRSYIDPTKDNSDEALHTQLWIDPAEEFLQYTHVGDPVDVTFGVKELKAFLSFCEGCEVDIHLFFEKAGEPILMAPRFGLDDGSCSDFDATLVLATMLVSQLNEGTTTGQQPVDAAQPDQDVCGLGSQLQRAGVASVCEHPSDHTKIWSELSGSVAKSSDGSREREIQMEGNPVSSGQNGLQIPNIMIASMTLPARENAPDTRQPMEINHMDKPQDREEMNGNPYSQNHPSNWVGEDADDDDDDGNEDELYVQPTPDYNE